MLLSRTVKITRAQLLSAQAIVSMFIGFVHVTLWLIRMAGLGQGLPVVILVPCATSSWSVFPPRL